MRTFFGILFHMGMHWERKRDPALFLSTAQRITTMGGIAMIFCNDRRFNQPTHPVATAATPSGCRLGHMLLMRCMA